MVRHRKIEGAFLVLSIAALVGLALWVDTWVSSTVPDAPLSLSPKESGYAKLPPSGALVFLVSDRDISLIVTANFTELNTQVACPSLRSDGATHLGIRLTLNFGYRQAWFRHG